jgi:hypothetical protein
MSHRCQHDTYSCHSDILSNSFILLQVQETKAWDDGDVAEREPKVPVYIACIKSIIQQMHSNPTTKWDTSPVVPPDGKVVSFKQTYFARVSCCSRGGGGGGGGVAVE